MFKLSTLSFALVTLIACSPTTSTTGQHITCEVDQDSGTIARCEPSDGTEEAGTCQDIDEDGDGMPGDDDGADDDGDGSGSGSGSDAGSGGDGEEGDETGGDADGGPVVLMSTPDDEDGDGDTDTEDSDDDNDGIDDEDDCDELEGEDGDESDLPYNFDMDLGVEYRPILDAFAEKGAQPLEIVSISAEGGGTLWRDAELQAGTAFVVTQDDCDHAGNKDVGRDRINITWRNADGSTESDHMTLRYCEE